LDCIIFDDLDGTNLFNPAVQREALEAEIAWLVKKETGEWPLLLSMINPHAFTSRDKRHRELVKAIHDELCNLNWFVCNESDKKHNM